MNPHIVNNSENGAVTATAVVVHFITHITMQLIMNNEYIYGRGFDLMVVRTQTYLQRTNQE